MSFEEPALLSEDEFAELGRKLQRVAFGSLSLVGLLVLILLAVVRSWAGVPLLVRVAFPAILLWSLVVAAYTFHSYGRAWTRMRAAALGEQAEDLEGSDDATKAGSAAAAH